MGAVKTMAKDLVRTRNYQTKFIEMRSHLQGAALKLETVRSHEAMATAMKSVTKVRYCVPARACRDGSTDRPTDVTDVWTQPPLPSPPPTFHFISSW